MDLLHSIAQFAGRLLKPVRAGERNLASRRLHVAARTFPVESPAFGDGQRIPDIYAGPDGRSPPLRFSSLPQGTREVVVLVEDPDAPMPRPFVHWIVAGIGPDLGELPEGLPPTSVPLANGIYQGLNTLHKYGWTGPSPPPGHGEHHYHFQLFALDAPLDAPAPLDRKRVVESIRGHIIGFGELVGTYETGGRSST